MSKKKRVFVFFRIVLFTALFLVGSESFAAQSEIVTITSNQEVFDSLSIDSTKGAWWYGGRAKDNYEDRDYEEAILDFSRAIFIDPDVSEFYYYRGNSFAFCNQSAKALNDFKKALELNPDYLSSVKNLGWEFLKRREFAAAFRYFVYYVRLMPKNPKMFLGVGKNADYQNLLSNLGWDALRHNELSKAVRCFTNYLKLAPEDPDAYLGLALVYYQYHDFTNATAYLDEAKNLEPYLFQGFSGLSALEKTGCVYTEADKNMIKALFSEVGNAEHDLQKLTTTSTWQFLLGFMYMVLGLLALLIFIIRIKRVEGFILYLAILNLSFGFKFLYDNPLIQIAGLPSPNFWIYTMPIIAAIIPITFILFVRYFIGWGWKWSILWLLVYSIFQGVVKIVSEYTSPGQDIYGTSNIIFGWLSAVVLFVHLFLPKMRKNIEVQIIGAGLGFYLVAIFYENLAVMNWLPDVISFDKPAYLFFNICLVYVAFRRITRTEKQLIAVNQDLETARNIQNAILPGKSPKGESYEIASAYVPMALIGGDYYDYQMKDESHIGVLIADVSGHGISAALIASMVKVAFNSQYSYTKQPAMVLEQINRSLSGQLNNEFITAGYFGVDLIKNELIYSSAGHPPLVLYRRITDEVTEVKVTGIPIGIYADTHYTEASFQLVKGDRLFLYTDGLLDVLNPDNEAFGRIRFMDLVKETKNLSPQKAIALIISAIHKWSEKNDSETYDDDITLIIFDLKVSKTGE